jgi:hypothetical protein
MLKSFNKSYGDARIKVGDEPHVDLFATDLRARDGYKEAVEPAIALDRTFELEEEIFSDVESATVAEGHSTIRRRAHPALRAIAGFAFEEYGLPTANGVEIGSGPLGYMTNALLPKTVDRKSWREVEINPLSVAKNQRLHPDSRIIQGSYQRLAEVLGENSVNLVAGLSSLDSTTNIDNVAEQIRLSLVEGGYLLHVQDIQPSPSTTLHELRTMGEGLPHVQFRNRYSSFGETFFVGNNHSEPISTTELFRRRMGRIFCPKNGFEQVLNHWITAAVPSGRPDSYVFHGGKDLVLKLPKGETQMDFASAVVTIARKI